jgi:hypothetical protein
MMSFLDRFRRQKEDPEMKRRARLLKAGRIAEGSVLDVYNDAASGAITQIFYSYTVSGVEYESSQSLDPAQQQRAEDYAPGARITIRYDPHQPFNSVVV